MPTIGEMRHRVSIELKTRGAPDGSGGFASETWSTLCTVWAKLDPKTGREMLDADQVVHRVSHIIIIRYRAGINAAMRVNYQGRIMAILGVRDFFENERFMELTCEETAPS